MEMDTKKLVDFIGIKVGKKYKFWDGKIRIVEYDYDFYFINVNDDNDIVTFFEMPVHQLTSLVEVNEPKKYGELKCNEIACKKCPLRYLKCNDLDIVGKLDDDSTLYDILRYLNLQYKDQELYGIIRKRLEEVEQV